MTRILYLDCASGIAGDMALAALVHAGADLNAIRDAVNRVARRDVQITAEPQRKSAIHGLRIFVDAKDEEPVRSAQEIISAIATAGLDEALANTSIRVFQRLAEAEALVHDVSPHDVHFHEVGALDSIADIVGFAAAIHSLGIDRIESSPLPMGRGFINTRHGLMPLPAPATLVLLRGWPIVGTDVDGETVTPTGAALISALAVRCGPIPPMRLEAVGNGFGTRQWPDGRPNCVRALIGFEEQQGTEPEWEVVANIDDMTPDDAAQLINALLAKGALDAWVQPIVMKKGRPAWSVHALATSSNRQSVVNTFFDESTTIGVRMHSLERVKLAYQIREVETSLGTVRVKYATYGGSVVNRSIENDDIHRIARERGMPVRRVRELLFTEIARRSSA